MKREKYESQLQLLKVMWEKNVSQTELARRMSVSLTPCLSLCDPTSLPYPVNNPALEYPLTPLLCISENKPFSIRTLSNLYQVSIRTLSERYPGSIRTLSELYPNAIRVFFLMIDRRNLGNCYRLLVDYSSHRACHSVTLIHCIIFLSKFIKGEAKMSLFRIIFVTLRR